MLKNLLPAGLVLILSGCNTMELCKKYQPETTSRVRENVEWTQFYSYNAKDETSPRVLMIGDSICCGYQDELRACVKNANFTCWETSRCVTDKDYFKELNLVLEAFPYQVICFNNGLHSLNTDLKEWETAYDGVIRFLQAKCPEAKLVIVNSTPLRDAKKTALVMKLNIITEKIAEKYGLPMVDLFGAMNPLDRKTNWRDTYHFEKDARVQQAKIIARMIQKTLKGADSAGEIRQLGSKTGPDGEIK